MAEAGKFFEAVAHDAAARMGRYTARLARMQELIAQLEAQDEYFRNVVMKANRDILDGIDEVLKENG